jgi:phosphoserine phosphatase
MTSTHTKVFFDFDSTLIDCESLDILAKKKGVFEEVDTMTKQAMNGEVPLESMFAQKMSTISPSRQEALETAYECISHITEGARDVISLLHTHGFEVHIISSGFHEIIDPITHILSIAETRVHANTLAFNSDGTYSGIAPDSPLTQSSSKPTLISSLISPTDTTYMIGDGMTDAACASVVTQFIGFGGHVVRDNVQKCSPIYITQKNLTAIIPYIQ